MLPSMTPMPEFTHLHVHNAQYSDARRSGEEIKDLASSASKIRRDACGRGHRSREHVRRRHLLQGGQGAGDPGDHRRRDRRSSCRAPKGSTGNSHAHHSFRSSRPRAMDTKNLVEALSSAARAGVTGSERPGLLRCDARGDCRAGQRHRGDCTRCMGGAVSQAILEEGEAAGRLPCSRVLEGESSSRAPSTWSCRTTGLPEQPVLNGDPGRSREALRPAARGHERRPLRLARRRRGPPLSVVHQDGALVRRGEGAAPRLQRDVPEVAGGDEPDLLRVPGGDRQHHGHRREVLPLEAQIGRADAPQLQGARRVRHRELLPPRGARKGWSGASASCPRWARGWIRRPTSRGSTWR